MKRYTLGSILAGENTEQTSKIRISREQNGKEIAEKRQANDLSSGKEAANEKKDKRQLRSERHSLELNFK